MNLDGTVTPSRRDYTGGASGQDAVPTFWKIGSQTGGIDATPAPVGRAGSLSDERKSDRPLNLTAVPVLAEPWKKPDRKFGSGEARESTDPDRRLTDEPLKPDKDSRGGSQTFL